MLSRPSRLATVRAIKRRDIFNRFLSFEYVHPCWWLRYSRGAIQTSPYYTSTRPYEKCRQPVSCCPMHLSLMLFPRSSNQHQSAEQRDSCSKCTHQSDSCQYV